MGKYRHAARMRDKQTTRIELWVLPTAMLVIGSVISIWHVARLGGGETAVVWAFIAAFRVLGAFVGYALITMLLTGWAYGLGQSLLRIGGILMILTAGTILLPVGGGPVAAGTILVSVGRDLFAVFLGWIVLCVMLITIMDLDINEGWIVTTSVMAGWICGGMLGAAVVGLIS